ncbi:MAG TPA: 30S ribosomal protein S17 [Candidatus Moranbacteria bacterium]|jgi:small subunit ribosomal protein S17|nr:30S ribosomal protein S17 [Candidatus Moranbacteria bacterium]HOF42757.1 30S ribosomal protein S17 [Candidatus Moranbacteria bacterium]HPX94436.1 30S ribosomal protein S17 [Candidatus Moranbacteria bacterium]HQB59446.1 30S ribosomal protein S17 [Candidatus Moranbacteria bacterium]
MAKKIAKKKGIVVSDAGNKTLVVITQSLKTHQKYLKKYKSTKKYKVHDEENKFKKGDVVEFIECKPISKDKRHKIL